MKLTKMHFLIGFAVWMFSTQICFSTMVEEKLIEGIDAIDNESHIDLIGGLSIQKLTTGRGVHIKANSLPERAEQYLQNHELTWHFPPLSDKIETPRNFIAESRTRKLKKMLLPLLLAMKLKLSVFIKLMIVFVKFVSLKALATSILALLFAGGSMVKDFLSKKKDHVTTAYISGTPLNAEVIQTDWSRTGQAGAQELAYSNYPNFVPQTV